TVYFFFSSRRRHTRFSRDWSSDVCSSDLAKTHATGAVNAALHAVGGDERAHALGHHHTLFFLIARSGLAVAHGQILQLALAALRSEERRVGKECGSGAWPVREQEGGRESE